MSVLNIFHIPDAMSLGEILENQISFIYMDTGLPRDLYSGAYRCVNYTGLPFSFPVNYTVFPLVSV